MTTCSPSGTVIMRGTRVLINFVWRDEVDGLVELKADDRFFLTMALPGSSITYDTETTPTTLYVQQEVEHDVDAEPFIADCLTLDLTPEQSRDVPPGNLTEWEIERWVSGNDAYQELWGCGRFSGHGGLNPDG